MSKKIFKHLARRPLLIGVVSLVISLVIFEGILAIALYGQESLAEEVVPEAVSSESSLEPEVQSPLKISRVDEVEESRSAAVCSSDYYAVVDASAGPACIRNPTPLMPHWGPPSVTWFRSFGGAFRAAIADGSPSDQCACLAAQSGYQRPKGERALQPIGQVIYEGTRTPIRKWVCGDPCMTNNRGGAP